MVIPPSNSYTRTTQYYLDLSAGTCDPAEIISDINFYNEQLNSLQTEYYQKAEELKTYKQKIEQIERAMESHSKDMNGIQQILSSLAVCLAKNKNIKIQKEEQ